MEAAPSRTTKTKAEKSECAALRCATSICAEPPRVEPANSDCFRLEFPTNFRDRGWLAGWLCICSGAESGEAHAPRPSGESSRVETLTLTGRKANRPAAFLRAHTKEREREGSQLWLLNLHYHHIASLSCPLGLASLIPPSAPTHTTFGHPRHPRSLLVLLRSFRHSQPSTRTTPKESLLHLPTTGDSLSWVRLHSLSPCRIRTTTF